MGQFTVKFNTERLMSGEERVDSWFPLARRPGKNEVVTGDLHLVVQFGNYSPKGVFLIFMKRRKRGEERKRKWKARGEKGEGKGKGRGRRKEEDD